jgi:hypothetical protein
MAEMDMKEKLVELLAKTPGIGWSPSAREMVADHLIAHGVTVQEWISVEDRLPEEDKDVLVFGYYHEAFQTLICHYRTDFKGQWFTSVAGQQVYEVTHWMPLPQPPKGE